ncbi:MAG: leucine-rich repeat protein, partial [Oscillospiraceae bacterium]|nr:leucine-rich repeat protein [Oscillospiraceae bacterium]
MKHRFQRALALLLSLALCLGLAPAALATSPAAEAEQEEAPPAELALIPEAEEPQRIREPASPKLRVTGLDGAELTEDCTVVWTDSGSHVLSEPVVVEAGTTVCYTVSPGEALKRDGVQYYEAVSGSVELTEREQPVDVALGQRGAVTVQVKDRKTGELLDYDEGRGWSVYWHRSGSNSQIGDKPTSPLCAPGEALSVYVYPSGDNDEKYESPDNPAGTYAVVFGNRVETVELDRKLPELSMYEYERPISCNDNMVVSRTDNGYTFASVTVDGNPVVIGEDTVDFGNTEMNFNARFLASLGLGEHVFVFHYAESTAEDNCDTTLTMTQTVGDIGQVRWRQSYRSSWSSFDKETYTGQPITKKPILYVGDWANDRREGMLREGVDYTVSYENNVNVSTDENKARMILTGIGNYAGSSRSLEFTIQPCNITQDGTTWFEVLPNFDWPILYDGQEHDLTDVTVKANGVTLVKGVDYTVDCDTDHWTDTAKAAVGPNGLPLGSATESLTYPVRITGIGNYSGSWTSWSYGSGVTDHYGVEYWFRIMPHVEETVGGGIVVNDIPWTWQLDPDGLLTVSGSGEMPEGFHSAYWVGGSDPDHYYVYGWWYDYREMIKRVVITGDVTGIEENAFWDCPNLVEVTLPDTVEMIRAGAFYSCRSLRTVHAPGTKYLPSSLHTLQNGAFGGNVYNLELWLPDNLSTIEVNNTDDYSRVYCKLGTTTHETLKAGSYTHMVEGYDGYYLDYQDNYNLGGTYTVYRYVGLGGNMVLPDFIDSITHYDIFSTAASRVTRLVIPGNIRVLNGDAFRFLDRCAELVIEPGEMRTLIPGLLNEHGDTVLTIPDTVTEMPSGDFSHFYSSLTVVVGEGSAAHRWAIAQGYIPDDGSGVGRMYRLRENSQPYVTPLSASVPGDAPTDVTVTKHDGDYTFSSLRCNGTALKRNTDYTRSGDTLKIKASYLAALGVGTHVFTLHYTGLAGEQGDIPPIDPTFRVTVLAICRPALTVTGQDGADLSADCAVVWKRGDQVLPEPVSVPAGTTLRYTVTPGDALRIGGVQYYGTAEGTVTLTEDGQPVSVALPPLGSVTVTPVGNGAALPAEAYAVHWYTRAEGRYRQIGTGATSPLSDAGATLYYDLVLSGEAGADWQDVEKAAVEVVFGNRPVEAALAPSATEYTVRFYLNGGAEAEPGSCEARHLVRNQSLSLPAAPVRRGWVFLGWSENYDGQRLQPGETVTVKRDVYYYALWTEMPPLAVSFEALGPLAGSVTLYGLTDGGAELSVWSAYRPGEVWEQQPVALANACRNENRLVSLILRGEVDGERVELARYDDPNGDLYLAEGTVTLRKTGTWLAVTEVRAEGLEAGSDFYAVDRVYRDPGLPRNDYARLPFLTDGGTAYYVRFSGVPSAAAYTGYDWTAVYALGSAGSVLHAAVTAIAPERWTGTVSYGPDKTPAANATVTVSQRAYGLDRSYSAVTDGAGNFTVEGFPDTAASVSVNWGGREAYFKSFAAMSNGMELNLNSVRVQWSLDFDGTYDPALRERLVTWSEWSSPTIRFTSGGKTVKSWGTALSDCQTQALWNVALDGLDWAVSAPYIEPSAGTVTLTDGAGEIAATLRLRAGVLARVNADVSCSAVLAWFDADGGFVGFSDGGLGLYGGDDRDWLCACPEESDGSYTLALMPASVRLDAGEALSDVPESWLFHVWPEVSLGKNEVAELESVRLTAEMNDNARYVTLPASTLS